MSRNPITQLVKLAQPSGVEINAQIVLDRQPTRLESKLKTVSQYLQQHPQGWKKHLELAELQCVMGCWDNAIQEYHQVLTRQPQLFAVRLKLAKVLAIYPDDLVALNQSYDALMAIGDIEEAQKRLQRAIALAPQDFPTLKRLVEMRCQQRLVWEDEGKQTKQMIQALIRLAPNAADGFNCLAYYHIFRGDRLKGIAVLEKFVAEHPNSPFGWYRYARCLFHTGDSQGAAEAILRAYQLYQKDWEIYRAICEILPEAGRLEELKPILEEMCDRFLVSF